MFSSTDQAVKLFLAGAFLAAGVIGGLSHIAGLGLLRAASALELPAMAAVRTLSALEVVGPILAGVLAAALLKKKDGENTHVD